MYTKDKISLQVDLVLSNYSVLSFAKIRKSFADLSKKRNSLAHPNIIQVIDFGEDQSRKLFFLVFELLSGVDLGSVLEQAPFKKEWVAAIIKQVCSALEKSHEEGIIHRDLKPSNIFLLPALPFPHVKLLDFGVAKLLYQEEEQRLTQAGEIIGTPAYVSPEQFIPSQTLTHRSDIYGLGVVVFQLLTGRLPINGASAIAHAVLVMREIPPLLGEFRPEFAGTELESLVACLLSKNPEERPKSMTDVWSKLARAFSILTSLNECSSCKIPEIYPPKLSPLKEEQSAFLPNDSDSFNTNLVPDESPNHPDDSEFGEETFVMPEGASLEDLGESTVIMGAAIAPPPAKEAAEGETTMLEESLVSGKVTEEESGREQSKKKEVVQKVDDIPPEESMILVFDKAEHLQNAVTSDPGPNKKKVPVVAIHSSSASTNIFSSSEKKKNPAIATPRATRTSSSESAKRLQVRKFSTGERFSFLSETENIPPASSLEMEDECRDSKELPSHESKKTSAHLGFLGVGMVILGIGLLVGILFQFVL